MISEWCSEWWALTDEFDGQFVINKSQLREYIMQILRSTEASKLQPVRPIECVDLITGRKKITDPK